MSGSCLQGLVWVVDEAKQEATSPARTRSGAHTYRL